MQPTMQPAMQPTTPLQPAHPTAAPATTNSTHMEQQRALAHQVVSQYKQLAELKRRFEQKSVPLTPQQQQAMYHALGTLERHPVIVSLRERARQMQHPK
jgi:DNA-binding PadR family transcriptional regulator